MKYRVINEAGFSTYFKTKREAVAYQAEIGFGKVQRKMMRGVWTDC